MSNGSYGERLTRVQAGDIDRLVKRFRERPDPIGLPIELVERTGPRRAAQKPIAAIAQVPILVNFTETIEVDAEVLEWTPGGAVKVRVTVGVAAAPREVWLWTNAVRPKP